MMRILCLWLPNWPIQRAIRCRPELKGRPVALVTSGPRGSEVAACCSTAVAEGVRPGMPLVEAQSLARELGAAAYSPEADRAALVKCAEACERFSPRVAIEDAAEPESLLLDISNLEHLWRSEARLAARVKKFFTSRGYAVRVAIAETVGAAWAAAHFEGGGRGDFGSPAAAGRLLSDCGLEDPNPQSTIRNPQLIPARTFAPRPRA
jgi:protein ImuB